MSLDAFAGFQRRCFQKSVCFIGFKGRAEVITVRRAEPKQRSEKRHSENRKELDTQEVQSTTKDELRVAE